MTWFYTPLPDDLGPEIEFEIECEIDLETGYPMIHGVYLDNVSLLGHHNPVLNALGHWVHDKAQTDSGFGDRARDEHGIYYRGMGGNDPDGHWRQYGT